MSQEKFKDKKTLPLNTQYEPMPKEIWELWNKFTETGKVEDYLAFSSARAEYRLQIAKQNQVKRKEDDEMGM